jgi:hypothetical protein
MIAFLKEFDYDAFEFRQAEIICGLDSQMIFCSRFKRFAMEK